MRVRRYCGKFDTADMIELDNSELIKIVKENDTIENESIEQWKQNLLHLFSSSYDTSVYSRIEDNSFLLSYYKKLKCSHFCDFYESLNKVNDIE